MSWELLLNPIVIETLRYYDNEAVQDIIGYLEHQLIKMPHPEVHADSQNNHNGIMTFSRTTQYGVVMIFAQIDYECMRIKILHVQLRNNAFDQS